MNGDTGKANGRQRVLADFGEFALRSDDLDEILTQACQLVANALGTERALILEIQDQGETLFVRAGIGWDQGVVGHVRLSMDEHSSETYSIEVGEPVITKDVAKEDRFDVPAFLKEAGVQALANVPIFLPRGRAYGLLQVDAAEPRAFDDEDTQFLRTYATILGPVLDRLLRLHHLQATEERFRNIVEAARDYAIIITDEQNRITDWLPGAEAVFGWTAAEAIGQSGAILFTPEDRQAGVPEAEMATAREHGSAPDVRWHRRKDGTRVFIEGSMVALRDRAGGRRGFQKIGQDVTQRRIAETLLRESEERLRQFGEASQDVLWIRDTETLQWQYLTPAFETIYGLSRADALSGDNYGNWLDMIVPEDRDFAVASIQRVIGGEQVAFEYRIRRPTDGTIRWLRNTDFPMRDADGQVSRFGGVGQDITELKQIEAALRGSEGRLRSLIEGVPQLIWRSDEEGQQTWASPQWLDYTGQTGETCRGWGWLDAVHPDDRETARKAWREAPSHGRLNAQYRLRRASDGAWRWHTARSQPTRDALKPGERADGLVEWLGTTTDIDDLMRLQGEQKVLVAELQHRTRNLLSVVRNIARRSMDPSPGRDEYDARLAAIGRVQGFLSRTPAYSVPLAEIVEAELLAAGDGASDKVEIRGPPVNLPGDSVQAIALALHELATNAVKYGAIVQPSGRLSVVWSIEAGGEDDSPRLILDWRESGVTMPDGPPPRRGYGSELITRALPYQLRAETALEFTQDGVRCRVILPASAFTSPAATGAA